MFLVSCKNEEMHFYWNDNLSVMLHNAPLWKLLYFASTCLYLFIYIKKI